MRYSSQGPAACVSGHRPDGLAGELLPGGLFRVLRFPIPRQREARGKQRFGAVLIQLAKIGLVARQQVTVGHHGLRGAVLQTYVPANLPGVSILGS